MKTLNLTLIFALICIVFAPTAHSAGYISVDTAYNAIDDFVGASGGFNKDFGKYEVELEASAQKGDIFEGEFHAAVARDIGPVQAKPFVEINTVKTDDWGGSYDGGAKLNVPYKGLDFAGGLFLRGSDAFRPIETGTRTQGVPGSEKWDQATLLNFDDLGLVNGILEVEFGIGRFKVGVATIFDISNQKFHQLVTDASASWQLYRALHFNLAVEYIAQAGENGGQQTDITGGVSLKF